MWCERLHRSLRRPALAALAAVACAAAAVAPARADESPPAVTVSAPGWTTSVTVADVAHWVRVARAADPQGKQRVLEEQALQFITSGLWIEGESAERGIVLSDAEVQAEFVRERRQSFPKWAAFQRFLRHARETVADIRMRVRLDLLSTRVRQQVVAPAAATVTRAVVDAAVRAAKPEHLPASRDLRIVVARTRAAALQARAALEAGASWAVAARRYSIDPTTRRRGGLVRRWHRADLPRRFGRTVFRAPRARLVGPVRSGRQYVVFEVVGIHPRRTIRPEQRRSAIRERLVEKAQQNALDTFLPAFDAKWRARTECASWFTWSSECGNWDGTPPGD